MKSSPTAALFRFILTSWRYTAEDRLRAYLFLSLLVAANLTLLIPPWVIAKLIDRMQPSSSEVWHDALQAVVLFIVITVIGQSTHHLARYIQLQVGYRARIAALKKLTLRSFQQSQPWHSTHPAGEVASRADRGATAVGQMLGELYFQGVSIGVRIIGALSVLFLLTGPMISLVLVGVVVTVLVMAWSNRPLMQTNTEIANFNAALLGRLVSGFGCVLSLKSYRAVKNMQPVLFAPATHGEKLARRQACLNEVKWGLTDLFHPAIVGLSILLFVSSRTSGSGSTGEI